MATDKGVERLFKSKDELKAEKEAKKAAKKMEKTKVPHSGARSVCMT